LASTAPDTRAIRSFGSLATWKGEERPLQVRRDERRLIQRQVEASAAAFAAAVLACVFF